MSAGMEGLVHALVECADDAARRYHDNDTIDPGTDDEEMFITRALLAPDGLLFPALRALGFLDLNADEMLFPGVGDWLASYGNHRPPGRRLPRRCGGGAVIKLVLEVDLTCDAGTLPSDLASAEDDLREFFEGYRFNYVTARWAQVEDHPPRFTRARETNPLVIGEQLILDREYTRVDI